VTQIPKTRITQKPVGDEVGVGVGVTTGVGDELFGDGVGEAEAGVAEGVCTTVVPAYVGDVGATGACDVEA
jgi:hypothetical protein